MSTVAFIEQCRAEGLSWEDALKAAKVHEAKALQKDAERRRRAAEKKARQRAEKAAMSPGQAGTEGDRGGQRGTGRDQDARAPAPARVRDITPNSENNHQLVVDVVVGAREQSDDWPEGDAKDHAALIVAEVASPWLDPNKSLALPVTEGRLSAWRKAGASWRFDVLPTIRAALAKQRKPIGSWKWFDPAIAQSIADNRAALAIPEAPTVIPIRSGQGPPSLADKLAAEKAEVRRIVLENLEKRNGARR